MSSNEGLLAIDGAGSSITAAVRTRAGTILSTTALRPTVAEPSAPQQQLTELVSSLLQQAAVSANELDTIVVGSGPGSFTGLRITHAFAFGLAIGCGAAILTLPSAAAQLGDSDKRCLVYIADARRDELFFDAFINRDGVWSTVDAPSLVTAVSLSSRLDDLLATERLPIDSLEVLAEEHYLPQLSGSLNPSLPRRSATQSAAGLLAARELFRLRKLSCRAQQASGSQVGVLEPAYVRAVAAKTILERTGNS